MNTVRVLVIDDEIMICEMLSTVFQLHGAEVVTAQSGNMALEIIKNNQFDIIISDVRMPNGDGPSFVRSLPTDYRINVKVFLMSGYNDLKEDELKELGVIKLFHKPFNIQEVISACGL